MACTHGGGVDPSPKAWDAIRVGTIPIIEVSESRAPNLAAVDYMTLFLQDMKISLFWRLDYYYYRRCSRYTVFFLLLLVLSSSLFHFFCRD